MTHIKIIKGIKYAYRSERHGTKVTSVYLGRADGLGPWERATATAREDRGEKTSEEPAPATLTELAKSWESKLRKKVNLHSTGTRPGALAHDKGAKEGAAGEPSGDHVLPIPKVNLQTVVQLQASQGG